MEPKKVKSVCLGVKMSTISYAFESQKEEK